MLCSTLHRILVAGGNDCCPALQSHDHSFIYAAVDAAAHVVSLHELSWDVRKPRCTASGALGWVRCMQSYGPGEPLPVGNGFRVHVCSQDPCTAIHHPSKYGESPAPLRHGKVVRVCRMAERVDLEAEWKSLRLRMLGDTDMVPEPSPTSPVPSTPPAVAPSVVTEMAAVVLADAADPGANAEEQSACRPRESSPFPTHVMARVTFCSRTSASVC